MLYEVKKVLSLNGCSCQLLDIFFMNYINVFALTGALIITSPAHSQQWADTGDSALRRDVELLKAYNIIRGPINTWPISWKQITKGLDNSTNDDLPAHVMRAIERVKNKSPNKAWRFKSDVRLSNEPNLIRGFGGAARADADLTLSAEHHSQKFSAKVAVNYQKDHPYNEVTLDGSYLAATIGNWSVYAGAIDRWWGPGQDNTLMLSTNARPMMSAGLRRNDPKPFKTKWLSWMGPWTWDMFVANMGQERHIPNALIAGMRLGFEPLKGFEVGLSRSLQLCGDNRPCSFNTWTRALISVGDLDNTGTGNEPGNQLASIDFSYSHRFGNKTLRAYISGTAEDQHIVTPFQYARLLGATLTSPIGNKGDMLTINPEWSDSGNVLAWFFGERRGGVIYRHHIYQTGHRYAGRSLGHSFDNDSKLISLSTTYTRSSGDSYRLSLRTATLNWDGTNRNIVSLTPQKYKSAEFSATNQFDFGRLQANVSVQTKAVTLTQGALPRFTAGISWQKEF